MARILVIAPHPDDEAIGCGGTLRQHVVAGDDVRTVFLTSGEQGGHGLSPEETALRREAEARRAAGILGIEDLQFWRIPDGRVRASNGLVERLQTLLRQWKPDTVYVTHSGEMHTDHRAAARLTRRAVRGLNPTRHRPTVLMYEVWTPLPGMDEIVDITAHVALKRRAIRAHRTQCAVMRLDEAALCLNRYRGEMHCWPEGDYAEVFRRMPL